TCSSVPVSSSGYAVVEYSLAPPVIHEDLLNRVAGIYNWLPCIIDAISVRSKTRWNIDGGFRDQNFHGDAGSVQASIVAGGNYAILHGIRRCCYRVINGCIRQSGDGIPYKGCITCCICQQ